MARSAADGGQSAGSDGSRRADEAGDVAVDSECGRFFRNLRGHLDLSRADLAARVGCPVSVIAALERGDAGDLPPWPETVRIVTALTAPLGLDPRPALRIVGRRWGADAASPPPVPSSRKRRQTRRAGRSTGRTWSAAAFLRPIAQRAASAALVFWSARTLVIAVALTLTVSAFAAGPNMLGSWASGLPAPLAGFLREARDFALVQFAPVKDGMRVIEVADPRTRRADKLRVAPR